MHGEPRSRSKGALSDVHAPQVHRSRRRRRGPRRCPDGKRLKTFGQTGKAFGAIDREYVNHRDTWVRTVPGTKGVPMTGVVYAICR
jgi:hypothetical protein